MSGLWWQDPFRMFQTNLREIDAGLDVEEVLDYLVEFGADTWLLSVGGILSNYPTDLDFQTRNPYLAQRASGDLIGDAVKAAGRRGIRVMGRMDFSKIDHRRAEQHPDWCFVDAAGDQQVYNGLTSVCPSGDYYQVKLFEVLDEVLDRYPVDGFFCNWMSFNEVDYSRVYRGVCHCMACRTRYADYAPGETLPQGKDSPGYETWQRFARDVLADLTGRIRDHLSARRPEAPLVLGDRADIVFHEANNAVGRPLWHHRTSEHVSAAKTYRPEVPVLTNSVAFVDMPYRMAGEEPHHFAQYLIQAIARGANPSTYIMGTPRDNPYECLAVAGELTRFHRDHHDVYRELVPAAGTLLVRPDKGAIQEFQGLYLALLQRHVPFDVLPEERLGDIDLGRYGVVVLPDLGSLAPDIASVLDRYCAAGGAVVATGNSGVLAEEIELQCLPAQRRLASHDTEEAVRSLHLRDSDHGVVPVVGRFDVIQPSPTAEIGWRALSRAPYGPPEKCHGHLELEHPGRLRAPYGQGRAVMLPWTVGRAYREVGLTAHRELVVTEVLWAGAQQIATGLPEQVEIVLGRSAAGRVIHLLNRSGDADQRFAEPLPIGPCWLELPDPEVAEVQALRAGVRLPVVDGRVEVPVIERFETLVF
ncbi:alpha-amylase family protein [Kribbella sp. CA-253562]|uniref:alpha-amylase family protein n=1 Tax=Kribbella sp. CA-253562 TaxID=3239942 RepID=UPI003D8D8BB9